MPSTFLGLNTGLSGLSYFQSALNTTSHNISNANTEGYSRQSVNANASDALRLHKSWGMMGTGIESNYIERERNVYYDNKYWVTNSRYAQYNTELENLSQLQDYMNEMTSEAGYSKWLSELSDSLQELAANPSDYTTRISFTLTADSVTDMINELSTNFERTQKSINDEIELAVSEVNSLAKQIYELTQEIITIELKGGNANDLRDQRGVCIDKLSEYSDVDVEERTMMFGAGRDMVESDAETMCVRIGNQILVDELGFNELMVVPRNEKINQSDVEGLVDIYWKCADGTAGDEFQATKTIGKICGLFDVRDGNNGEAFSGTTTIASENPAEIKVKLEESIHVNKLTVPPQGIITLNGRDYMYDGWTAEYDEDGFLNNFTFQNMTMLDEKGVEIAALFPSGIVGHTAQIGLKNETKGVPYYQAQLNELVRVFSKYMNDLTTSGVDANGDEGMDAFTAKTVDGPDFVLKGTMPGTGVLTAIDSSYYRLTGGNWELNQDWKIDPSKVVVSEARDIEQGDIEARPIVDKMIFGITDATMFQQGTVSQFMHAFTTNMAVDIKKMQVFSDNQDDIRYVIDAQRSSISGVDKNEEASNLTKFQQLYNLASKVISVLNEVYDKLINQTGV